MDGLETKISVFFNLTDMDSACEFSYTNIINIGIPLITAQT